MDKLRDESKLRSSLSFLQGIQTILADGSFVSTYKFALLHALCDLAVIYDYGDGREVVIPVAEIAERFAELYWKQSIPYEENILLQNSGRQAAMIRIINEYRNEFRTYTKLRKDERRYRQFISKTVRLLDEMPLWRLQTYNGTTNEFIYRKHEDGKSVILLPGVAQNFSLFGAFITEMARNKWELMIRRLNQKILGDSLNLNSFLFGADRSSLQKALPIFRDIQNNTCFYCGKEIKDEAHVDHFISWSRYAADLAHNFVLTDARCNLRKSDSLAADHHLERWQKRNSDFGNIITTQGTETGLDINIKTTESIARWAYRQACGANEKLWLKHRDFRTPGEVVQMFIGVA